MLAAWNVHAHADNTLHVGSKRFTESYILGEVVRQVSELALLGRELEADPVCDAYLHV